MSASEERPIQISMKRAGVVPTLRTRWATRRGMTISSFGAASQTRSPTVISSPASRTTQNSARPSWYWRDSRPPRLDGDDLDAARVLVGEAAELAPRADVLDDAAPIVGFGRGLFAHRLEGDVVVGAAGSAAGLFARRELLVAAAAAVRPPPRP